MEKKFNYNIIINVICDFEVCKMLASYVVLLDELLCSIQFYSRSYFIIALISSQPSDAISKQS